MQMTQISWEEIQFCVKEVLGSLEIGAEEVRLKENYSNMKIIFQGIKQRNQIEPNITSGEYRWLMTSVTQAQKCQITSKNKKDKKNKN